MMNHQDKSKPDLPKRTRKSRRKSYQGSYQIQRPEKYVGDHKNVVYRSLWERQVFVWCEMRDEVVKWGSECVVIPYPCPNDPTKMRRYFVDVFIEFSDGRRVLVEIKPDVETRPPEKGKKGQARLLKESQTYAMNASKWHAAKRFAKQRGFDFEVWTEHTLINLGMNIQTGISRKKRK